MKRIGTLVLVVAAAVLLSGAAKGKDLPDLEVGSLTLKDKAGRVGARLIVYAHGPVLAFYGKDGPPRATLGVDPDGSAILRLHDKAGKTRAMLSVDADGSPGLVLSDTKGDVLWQAPR